MATTHTPNAALFSGSRCYFFFGDQYLRVSRGDKGAGEVDLGYPNPISRWKWKSFGKKGIDAALYSGSKCYFFSGKEYIRVTRGDTGAGKVDRGYPKTISSWKWGSFGRNGIDAALYSGSKCYFFSGKEYIRVTRGDKGAGKVDRGYPKNISSWRWQEGSTMKVSTHFAVPGKNAKSLNALIIKMINGAPKGSYIGFDVGRFNDAKISAALVKASNIGVNVDVVLSTKDKSAASRTRTRLRAGSRPCNVFLGQVGHGGPGHMDYAFDHNKLFLFSKTKYDGLNHTHLVVLSSGNLTSKGQTKHQATTIISYRDYFRMASEYLAMQAFYIGRLPATGISMPLPPPEPYGRYTWPANDGSAAYYTDRIYFFPKKSGNDPLYNTLDPSEGLGLHPNHASAKGRPTKIRIVIAKFMKPDLAKVLRKLAREGNCEITILARTNKAKGTDYINFKSTRNMRIKFLDTSRDTYFHGKYMLVEGPWGRKNPKHTAGNIQWRQFVYHGTRNWTESGLALQDNMALKISDKTTYDEFLANFQMLEAKA